MRFDRACAYAFSLAFLASPALAAPDGGKGESEGRGDAVKVAESLHAGLALSKAPLATPATTPAAANADPRFNVAAIDKAMDRKGTLDGAVYKYTIARTEAVDCASSFLSAGLVSDNSRVARDMGSLDVAHSF